MVAGDRVQRLDLVLQHRPGEVQVVPCQRAQERDPAPTGRHREAARLPEGEPAGAGVLAGERRRPGHRPQTTASSSTTAAAAHTTATAIHSDACSQVGRESANTRNPTVNAR